MARGDLTPQEIEMRKIVSGNINRLMQERSLRQIDLHNGTGIHKSTITGYIKGTSTPIAGNVQKMADFFGVQKSDIDPRFDSSYKKTQQIPSDTTDEKKVLDEIFNKLEKNRQDKIINLAKFELKDQKQVKITPMNSDEKIYTEADFDLMARRAVAFGGGEIDENDLNIIKNYLRNNTERIKEINEE